MAIYHSTKKPFKTTIDAILHSAPSVSGASFSSRFKDLSHPHSQLQNNTLLVHNNVRSKFHLQILFGTLLHTCYKVRRLESRSVSCLFFYVNVEAKVLFYVDNYFNSFGIRSSVQTQHDQTKRSRKKVHPSGKAERHHIRFGRFIQETC